MGGVKKTPPGWLSLVISRWMLEMSSNFMTLFLSIFATSHWSHFSKKIFENLKNGIFFSTVPTSKGPPFENFFFKINFFHFFSNKSYFFNLNLHFTCSELSFEVYNMSFGENFQIFIFYYRIPINNQVLSATSHG